MGGSPLCLPIGEVLIEPFVLLLLDNRLELQLAKLVGYEFRGEGVADGGGVSASQFL